MVDGFNTSWVDTHSIRGFLWETNSTLTLDYPNSEAWLSPSVNIVRGVCLVVISVLGASFNIFMIVAIVPNRRLRTVRNILLVHLGGVGLMSSVFITSYPALATFYGRWLGGAPVCQAHAYATCVFTSVSVWTIAALSWDKYLTIASPLHHSLTATLRKMLPCFLLFWMCALTLSLPPLFGTHEFSYHSPLGTCGARSSTSAGRWYTSVLICLSFVFPFCLMIYCYVHIFRIARTQSSRIAATMLRMVSLIEAPITSSVHTSLSMRGTKAMGTILQLIGSFILTYLPYAIIILYEVIFSVHANDIIVSIATTLFLAAPFTHASIYGIRNQILRSSFRRYARRKIQHCCTKDKRRGSVKSLTRKPSTALRIPMRNMAMNNDEKQCILQRKLSCQAKPVDLQEGAFENKGTCLSRQQSYDLLGKTNGWPNLRFDETDLDTGSKVVPEVDEMNEVTFCVVDDVSFTQPDLVSHATRHEISFYAKNVFSEKSLMGWEIEDMPKLEPEKLAYLGQETEDESSSDTPNEEPSKLYPIKEIMANFELRKSKERASLLKTKSKCGRPKKKSTRQHQKVDPDESSVIGVCRLDNESHFDHEVDVEDCLA